MENLILIHGALGAKKELLPIGKQLENEFNVFYYEIPGHGERSNDLGHFSMDKITLDFLSYLHPIGPSFIFGFSLGGYLALNAARTNSSYIKGIITLGTKLAWNKDTAEKEVNNLQLDNIKTNTPVFYDYLNNLHGENLAPILSKTAEFITDLGHYPRLSTSSVKSITIPVHLTRGGKDKMVTQEETQLIAQELDNGYYFELPSFIHPLGFLKPTHIANHIRVQLGSMQYKKITTRHGLIAYKKIGEINDNSTVVIFLHEALGSIAQWKDFPEALCTQLNLPGIVLELPGYGFSDPSRHKRDYNYLHQFAHSVIPDFIENLGLKNNILLVGHSDGGTAALLMSRRLSFNIVGVVTIAAHVLNEPETRNGIQPAIQAFEEGKMKGLEIYHGAKTKQLFYDWAHTWLAPFFNDWNIQKDIMGIETPGLIIQGVDDQYGTEKQVELIADCFNAPVQKILLDDCGHAPHIEQPQHVINSIKSWKEKLN